MKMCSEFSLLYVETLLCLYFHVESFFPIFTNKFVYSQEELIYTIIYRYLCILLYIFEHSLYSYPSFCLTLST
jgi:hypothetical protein